MGSWQQPTENETYSLYVAAMGRKPPQPRSPEMAAQYAWPSRVKVAARPQSAHWIAGGQGACPKPSRVKATRQAKPSDPLTVIRNLTSLERRTRRELREAIVGARQAGLKLAVIADAAGVTRQRIYQVTA